MSKCNYSKNSVGVDPQIANHIIAIMIDYMVYTSYNRFMGFSYSIVWRKNEKLRSHLLCEKRWEHTNHQLSGPITTKTSSESISYYNLLAENGNELPEKHTKYIRQGLYELRIQQGSDIVRILYFFLVDRKVILTSGFIKKSAKIPLCELELALKFKNDYLERTKTEVKNEHQF